MAGHPIKPLNPAHKGLLHKEMGKPKNAPLSLADLEEAKESAQANDDPDEVKRATFAINARGWRKVGGK